MKVRLYLVHRMADHGSAGTSELFRPALFLLSHYPNPSQLDLVYFSVMLKSTPEEEVAVKLQEILSAFVAVTRHQLPGIAVGLRSLAVVCNTLRTESIF